MKSNTRKMVRGSETQIIGYNSDEICSFYRKDSGTEYRVVRKENVLTISGIINGKKIEKSVEIDSSPWYQTVHDFSTFALTVEEGKSMKYWVVRPADAKVVKMKAENIAAADRINCKRVKVNPSGIYASFWKAHYTYRESDGLFIEYRAPQGGPGSEETVISLMKEQYSFKQ